MSTVIGKVHRGSFSILWTTEGWVSDDWPEAAGLLNASGLGSEQDDEISSISPTYCQDVLDKAKRLVGGNRTELLGNHQTDPEGAVF